jgi:Tol biopolymer transport system component
MSATDGWEEAMRRLALTLFAFLLLLSVPARLAAQTGRDLFQQALVKERANGDLRGAIAIYERIVREFTTDRPLTANALVQIGECYEKLGSTEAARAYQRVVSEFADQTDYVAQARARLAALRVTAVAARGPVARMIFTSENPPDRVIQNPRLVIPSPDGRHLAYVQTEPGTEGVYLWDLATGTSDRVTPAQKGVAYGSMAWSADGKRIAYEETDTGTKVGTIRILDLASRASEAVPRLDARGLHPVDWSRDGRYLLCTRGEKNTLELVTVADGTVATVSDSVWSWQRASISPDGRYVAYGAGPHTRETLYVQPLAGGPRIGIAQAGGEMYLHPLWSPDGSAIAYQENDGIWVRPMKDGAASGPAHLAYRSDVARWVASWTEAGGLYFTSFNQVNIPMEVEVDPRTAQAVGSGPRDLEGYPDNLMTFRWSPDGRSVAVNAWWEAITVQSTETGATRSLSHLVPEGMMIMGGEWSPDGREVWYQVGSPLGGTATLKAVDVSTGTVRELFPPLAGRAGGFSVSADGRTMAFLRPQPDKTISVLVAPTGQADGRVVAKINVPGQDPVNQSALPQISPRGDQVFYALQRAGTTADHPAPGAGSIWVVGADGGGARKVATAPFIESAMWDPTGRFIAYAGVQPEDTTTVLRVVEVATGAVHNIPMEKTHARIAISDWSRDGRHIGIVRYKVWWEYWAVQGLENAGQ